MRGRGVLTHSPGSRSRLDTPVPGHCSLAAIPFPIPEKYNPVQSSPAIPASGPNNSNANANANASATASRPQDPSQRATLRLFGAQAARGGRVAARCRACICMGVGRLVANVLRWWRRLDESCVRQRHPGAGPHHQHAPDDNFPIRRPHGHMERERREGRRPDSATLICGVSSIGVA